MLYNLIEKYYNLIYKTIRGLKRWHPNHIKWIQKSMYGEPREE